MSLRAPITVVVADDDPLVRSALVAIILALPELEPVGEAGDANNAIAVVRATDPDVALLDVSMPGGGEFAAREILRSAPRTRSLALSGSNDPSQVLGMLEAGCVGYLVKGGPIDELVRSIESAVLGRPSLSHDVLGNMITELITQRDQGRLLEENLAGRREQINRILTSPGVLEIVGQPICRLDNRDVVGFEALSRFHLDPDRTPDAWFAEAGEVGLQEDLEIAAVERALGKFADIAPAAYLAINVSPEIAVSQRFVDTLDAASASRIVLEITEHAPIADYQALKIDLEPIRARGIRLSVDDAGAGFASFRHVLELSPDFIKLDISLIRGVGSDPSHRALASGLTSFADDVGATIVAEGIETVDELHALADLGVRFGQGHYLGRPSPNFGLTHGNRE